MTIVIFKVYYYQQFIEKKNFLEAKYFASINYIFQDNINYIIIGRFNLYFSKI